MAVKVRPRTKLRDFYVINIIRIILKLRQEVKFRVTPKCYATLCDPKLHPHSEFRIPTFKKICSRHFVKNLSMDSVIKYYGCLHLGA